MSGLRCLTKMYYIMEGNGNFYRLSSSGQLIVASGKEEAETFTFVDANRKIGGGKKAKELDALRALTECFDCRSMSEALEYSVQEMEQIYGTAKIEAVKENATDMMQP